MLERQLTAIRGIQASALTEPANPDDEMTYVIELSSPPPAEALPAWFADNFPGIEAEFEPVFPEDEAPCFFLAKFSRVYFKQIPGSPFEIAYAMEASARVYGATELLHAEPALEIGFTGLGEEASPQGNNLWSSNCFTPIDQKPSMQDPDGLDFDWALQALNVFQARDQFQVTGKGIRIAHIDTGIARHNEIRNIHPSKGENLFNEPTGALDPLTDPEGFLNPGHGTATSSVIMSPPSGLIQGVSPDACFLPIRAIRTVIRLTQWRVARAIDRARNKGAHIITMSLGGIWSWALAEAVRRAREDNILIMAAAGNCVGFVVYPARFERCIAVAGTSPAWPRNVRHLESAWRGSCRGNRVDISAPAQFVWCASRKAQIPDQHIISAGEGTSFAVALTAGVAALWLENFGRDTLLDRLSPGQKLVDLFQSAVMDSARTTPQLGPGMGAGIVDAFALLSSPPAPIGQSGGRSIEQPEEQLFGDLISMLEESGLVQLAASSELQEKVYGNLRPYCQELQWALLASAGTDGTNGISPDLHLSTGLVDALDKHPELRNTVPG